MTPQELKNSILQLAIQGKLVEHSRYDEPIYVNSSYTGNTDDLFDIPDNWKWVAFRDVVTIETGLSFKKEQQRTSQSGDLRVLRGGNIGDDFCYHIFDDDIFVELHMFESKYIPLKKNDVITPSVTSMEKIGKTGFIDNDFTNITAGGFVYIIRGIHQSIIEPKYFQYFFSSSFNKEKCKPNIHKSGQAFYNLKKSGLIEQPICLPPLAEQKRIVAKIEELLPLIDRYEAAYTKLEDFNKRFPGDMQKSILQLAIQGKLVEQRPEEGTAEELYKQIQEEKSKLIKEGKIKKEKPLPEIAEDEKPFDIPESWKWVRLREVVYNRGQITPQNAFSYIDIGSIDNKHHRLNDDETIVSPEKAPSRARKIVDFGDILYSTVRPYLHNMCIIDRPFSCMPIASTGFATMVCYSGQYNKFLFYYLLSPVFDSYANDNENAKGVAYPAINDDKLYKSIVPLSPLAEQKRIVAKIEELMPLCERLK